MIETKITVEGITFNDYQNARVTRSTDDFNSSSDYTIRYDSPFGRHDDDFTVGNEIKFFADQDAAPTTNIFTGIVERIKFIGKGTQQKVELRGRDFSARLQDVTVEPSVFTNSEISTIVTNIMDDFVDDVTTNNVNVTSTTLPRIAFNHTTVFEALTELAKLAGFMFFVDENKDLHFEQKENISSGITLDNTNIIDMISNQTREGMFNNIWVYGDRSLTGITEVLTNDGSPWGGRSASEFLLTYKPHNTQVEVLGDTKIGGVFQMVSATSGIDYWVNFEDRQIIFQSGTAIQMDSIPISGGSVLINYDRDVPIVKTGDNDDSIALFGKKTKIINDKSIKDPNTALDILKKELEKGDPFRGMELTYQGWASITPGNTVEVTLSNFGLSTVTVGILSVEYKFDKNTVNSEKVIKFKLDKKILDITDQITDLRRRLTLIEAFDRQSSDVITRLKQAAGSFAVVGSHWEVSKTTQTGSTMLLSDSIVVYDGPGQTLAADANAGSLAGGTNGSAYGPFILQASGGFT